HNKGWNIHNERRGGIWGRIGVAQAGRTGVAQEGENGGCGSRSWFMSLSEFIQYFSWAIYLLIFIVVTARAIRRPSRASIDIALLFGLVAAIIAISEAASKDIRLIPQGPIVAAITSSLLLAMIYMLLRLVADFSEL